jgi:hypothetical protein
LTELQLLAEPTTANAAAQQKGKFMSKRPVGTRGGKATPKAKAQKSSKLAAAAPARRAKAAAVKTADEMPAPPVPTMIEETVTTPIATIATPEHGVKPKVAKPAVKAKKRQAPKPAPSKPVPVSESAAATVVDAAPEPMSAPAAPAEIEEQVPASTVELPSPDVLPLESEAVAALDSSLPADLPIDVVSPIPEPVEADALTAEDAPIESAPVEALVVEIEASAEGQSEVTAARDEYGAATPVLEDFFHSITDQSLVLNAASDLMRQNLDLVSDSSSAATASLETLGQEIAEFGWRQFDEVFAAWKRLLQAGSPIEGFASQCDYTCGALDGLFGQGAKITLAMMKLASDVTEPMTRPHSLGTS